MESFSPHSRFQTMVIGPTSNAYKSRTAHLNISPPIFKPKQSSTSAEKIHFPSQLPIWFGFFINYRWICYKNISRMVTWWVQISKKIKIFLNQLECGNLSHNRTIIQILVRGEISEGNHLFDRRPSLKIFCRECANDPWHVNRHTCAGLLGLQSGQRTTKRFIDSGGSFLKPRFLQKDW